MLPFSPLNGWASALTAPPIFTDLIWGTRCSDDTSFWTFQLPLVRRESFIPLVYLLEGYPRASRLATCEPFESDLTNRGYRSRLRHGQLVLVRTDPAYGSTIQREHTIINIALGTASTSLVPTLATTSTPSWRPSVQRTGSKGFEEEM